MPRVDLSAARLDPAVALTCPVARVAVDVSLSHLDRPFDYAVLPDQDALAVPGSRVRVRFAGRLRDGFVLERLATTEADRVLTPLHKVISAEPVLTPEVARLLREVADHYAGSFADTLRLAVPPRHAATEKADPPSAPPAAPALGPGVVQHYPDGEGFLTAARAGTSPRALWQLTPSSGPAGDWAIGFAEAARAVVDGGRGAVLIAPDQRDLARLAAACARVVGRGRFVTLVAEAGPAARYRAFLAALRGQVRVVIGNRAAAYAPVHDLGLVALWDDGDDLLSEPRAPYPHTREVLVLRATQTRAAVLFAGYARTAELQRYAERGWLRPLQQPRATVRHTAPRVRVSADSDLARERDPAGAAARLPHEAFTLIRNALTQGPVLVQVPRAGGRLALVCQDCREPVRCRFCHGPTTSNPTTSSDAAAPRCEWCGRAQVNWTCPECGGSRIRAPLVGAARTALELGRAFPSTTVRRSGAGQVLSDVSADPALVVCTPGAEPVAAGGYAGAVLLDTAVLLLRPDLRAAEEALRRWLHVVALVRGGAEGGSVLAVGDSRSRALQALVRVDPAGFAARELAERADAHFPPAVKVVTVDGAAPALAEYLELAQPPPQTETLGPVPLPPAPHAETELLRLTLRAPAAQGEALVRAAREVAGVRSARKSEGSLRLRVDPPVIG